MTAAKTNRAIPESAPDPFADALQVYFPPHHALPPPELHARVLRDVEKPLIERILALTGGNQLKAARILGLNRNTLRTKIRDLGIEVRKG